MKHNNYWLGGNTKQISKEKAAVWVPDPEAPVCMRCNKTKFTVVQRRVIIVKGGPIIIYKLIYTL